MNQTMRDYLRVGIIHFMAYPSTIGGEGPILETLKKIVVDDYFDAVSVTWMKDPEVRRRARRLLEESHMEVSYGAHPRLLSQGLNVNDLDEDRRRKALETLKKGIDEACELGASSFVFLSGPWQPETREDAFQRLVESTRELCGYAAAKGDLRVVHENFDQDIDKKSLIGPTSLALRYAKEITENCNHFGLLVDLSHIPLIGEGPNEALRPVKDHLVSVDIGNCVMRDPSLPRYGDTHPRFGFPGGENDVPQVVEFLKTLLDMGFLNREKPPVVSFEVRPSADEDPEAVIANAKRTLNEAWTRIE